MALARAIDERTRAIIVVNPNNPTGSFLKKTSSPHCSASAASHRLALISDEVFSDYGWAGRSAARSVAQSSVEDVLTFSMSGLSKVAGLPQLKLGWIVTNGPAPSAVQACENLELIADTYLSVGTPVQWAAASLLDARKRLQPQILDRVLANRAFLAGPDWAGLALAPARSRRRLVRRDPSAAHSKRGRVGAGALSRGQHVLVQPGFFFDFESEAFLVVSLLTPARDIPRRRAPICGPAA